MSRVLIVEDNEMNRDMLTRRLMRRGYTVITAVNGREGIDQARAGRPDVILMDLSLPVMDGWEAIRHIRNDPFTAAIPVIALTAHALAADHAAAFAVGADDVDTKPVDLERLIGKIEAQLEQRRQPGRFSNAD